ncbi:enoyl-CoA hydratase-related protein [Actinomadura macra]|uniref:enoyl-CoA hydratase-related protein n=1 Tax=Actinomadura macra TaxID=46164 RepID=UPI0008352BF6|nr:enoyl-CoA hydratase-related protein [Actinomadura macra]
MTADEGTVHYERRGKLALIRLDRPGSSNAIDPPTLRALGEAYHRADNDDSVVTVVLHASGPDFSVGLDPQSFLPVLKDRTFSTDGPGIVNPFGTTTRLSKPLVVAVQGQVGAMAHELMLAADIRIAAAGTLFGQGEAGRGTTPAGGGGIRMPLEVGWANAMRWILTGEHWTAEEALRLGLVQEVVAPGEQLPKAIEIAERIASHPPLALRETLRLGRRAWEGHAQHVYADLLPTLHRLLATEDFAERLSALHEGREPVYAGR